MRYLDHNATSPVDPRVGQAIAEALERGLANPSSVHGLGRQTREIVENARRQVARACGAEPLGVTFVSGGTEANNLALLGGARALRAAARPHGVLTTTIEHPAVTAAAAALRAEGVPVVWLEVDAHGLIDPDRLTSALREHSDIGLVSLAAANHELGNAYPIAELAERARAVRPELLVHTDAVQVLGKGAVDLHAWGVDMLSLSAHKFGGPQGVGALVHRKSLKLHPQAFGGHQERGRRVGTENVLGAIGMGAAARLAADEWRPRRAHVQALSAQLRAGLVELGARIHGARTLEETVGNTVNFAFEGCDGELMCMNLDLEGFAVSTGAACSAGSLEPSPVLLGLGLPPARAREAVRVSLGPSSELADVEALLDALPSIVARIREAGR